MIIDLTLIKLFIISFLKFLYVKFILSLILNFNDNFFSFIYPTIYLDNDNSDTFYSDSDSDSESSDKSEKENNYDILNTITNKIQNKTYEMDLYIKENEIYILECFACNITKDNIQCYQFRHKLILFHHIYNKLNSMYLKNIFQDYKYIFIKYKKNNSIFHKLIDLETNYDVVSQKKILFNRIIL
jgi:hypothetical protein